MRKSIEEVVFLPLFFFPKLGELIPLQERSEHPEPLPFILLAYALDEKIGSKIRRVNIARAAVNRLNEILFISFSLGRPCR